jgi:hypothetical protein
MDYVPIKIRPSNSDTSDETKVLEERKNKRQSQEVMNITKKFRPTIGCPDD